MRSAGSELKVAAGTVGTMGEIAAGGLFEAAMSDHVSPMTAAAAMASSRWLWREEAERCPDESPRRYSADRKVPGLRYGLLRGALQPSTKTGHRRALVYWTRHLAMLPHRPRRQNQRPGLWCRLYLPKAIGD